MHSMGARIPRLGRGIFDRTCLGTPRLTCGPYSIYSKLFTRGSSDTVSCFAAAEGGFMVCLPVSYLLYLIFNDFQGW